MKILVDENMPYAEDLFGQFGEVLLTSGRNITPEMLVDIDLLLVRSVTQVNQQLLSQAKQLKFVGTATIGTDHLDIDYLSNNKIQYSSAPGCNRFAVAEYVLSSILSLSHLHKFDINNKSIAIIGAGNTGSALEDKLKAIGIQPLLCDPLLQQAGDPRTFVDTESALKADIISLHVPINKTGPYQTHHLIDEAQLNKLSPQQILINACRGSVINNQALLKIKQAGLGPIMVLDVWEPEPNFNQDLLPYITLATPHIAGYSLEGKARGTWQLYKTIAKLFNLEANTSLGSLLPASDIQTLKLNGSSTKHVWQTVLPLIYNINDDDKLFRSHAIKSGGFDKLRKTYKQRREYSSLCIDLTNTMSPDLKNIFSGLKFKIKNG